jgi:hypothetical protein
MSSCAADRGDRLLPRHYFRLDPEIYSIVKDRHRRPVTGRAPRTGARRVVVRGFFGGADRDRTDDLRLAKPALSQLSYSPEWGRRWWAWADLNSRPPAYQADALTN